MSLLLVRHFESLTVLLEVYESLKAGGTWPYDTSIIKAGADPDPTQNEILSLVRTPRGLEICKGYGYFQRINEIS